MFMLVWVTNDEEGLVDNWMTFGTREEAELKMMELMCKVMLESIEIRERG